MIATTQQNTDVVNNCIYDAETHYVNNVSAQQTLALLSLLVAQTTANISEDALQDIISNTPASVAKQSLYATCTRIGW